MSLKHILLGILQEPKSGYDIKQMFDEVFSNFWAAKLSQIYPQLKKMTTEGWLQVEEAQSEKGPNKKIYNITEKGQQELVDWIEQGPLIHTERLAYLAQIFFLNSLETSQDKLEFMQQLHSEMKVWHQSLVAIQEVNKEEYPDYPHDLPDEQFYPNLTLMMGVKKVGAIVEWAEESIKLIEARL